jgi:hypothetical protein
VMELEDGAYPLLDGGWVFFVVFVGGLSGCGGWFFFFFFFFFFVNISFE